MGNIKNHQVHLPPHSFRYVHIDIYININRIYFLGPPKPSVLLLQQLKSSCRVVKMPESKPKPEQVQLLKDLKRAMIYNHIDPNLIRYYIYIYLAHGRSFTRVSCRRSTSTNGWKRSDKKPKGRRLRHIPCFVRYPFI